MQKNISLSLFILYSLVIAAQDEFILYSEYKSTKQIVDITNYLPNKFVKDGSINYTTYLQAGLDENKNVIFPDFPIKIDIGGLILNSGQKVFFNRNSLLVLVENSSQTYRMISINNKNDIQLFNPRIVGDKKYHIGSDGQWGMGISIKGSKNVIVYNPIISDCWGDGIYITSFKGRESRNVRIIDGNLNNNRRNGISIISGVNIEINNTIISNTGPQNPQSGIDIEPNSNSNILENIKLYNIKTFNNGRHGIVISPGNIKGEILKSISIRVKNHSDVGSKIGLGISLERLDKNMNSRINGVPVKGYVLVENSKWLNNLIVPMKNYGVFDNKISLLIY